MDILNRPDLAWCMIEGQLVFLDLANDRYFLLPRARNEEALRRLELQGGRLFYQPAMLSRPDGWSEPVATCSAISEGRSSLGEIAHAIWLQRRTERRLAASSLLALLVQLRRARATRPVQLSHGSNPARLAVRAFERARLLRTAADRCLPRSIALAALLISRGCKANLVIGVRLGPFAAHCWVQGDTEVLNDSLEEVLRFTPILVT